MFQSVTDLIVVFIGYPISLGTLWAVCEYLEHSNTKPMVVMALWYFLFFSLFIFIALT